MSPERITDTCRFCLLKTKEKSLLKPIGSDLRSKYEELTQTEMAMVEPYPIQTCDECSDKVINTFYFTKQLISKQNELSRLIKSKRKQSEPVQEEVLFHGHWVEDHLEKEDQVFDVEQPDSDVKVVDLQTGILYRCSKCTQVFKSAKLCASHEQTHSETLYRCSKCTQIFRSAKLCVSHQATHEENRKDYHLKTRHSPLKCLKCYLVFSTKHELQVHKIIEHPFKCVRCHETFETKPDLGKHILVEHRQKKSVITRRKLGSTEP